MVATIFMHLSHERKWIYGALILTVIGFFILMSVPILTISDGIGTPIHVAAPAAEQHKPAAATPAPATTASGDAMTTIPSAHREAAA